MEELWDQTGDCVTLATAETLQAPSVFSSQEVLTLAPRKPVNYKPLEPFRDHFVRAEGGIWGLPEKGGEISWLLP